MAEEQELKYRLASRQELEKVAALLPEPVRVEHQHNLYFDTPELELHRKGILARLRRFEGAENGVVTLKRALRLEPGRVVAEEQQKEVSAALVQQICEDPAGGLGSLDLALWDEICQSVSPQDLTVVGELRTYRRIYRGDPGEVALDVVDLGGATQWELELETPNESAGRAFLEELFRSAGVAAQAERETKTARLFRHLQVGQAGTEENGAERSR